KTTLIAFVRPVTVWASTYKGKQESSGTPRFSERVFKMVGPELLKGEGAGMRGLFKEPTHGCTFSPMVRPIRRGALPQRRRRRDLGLDRAHPGRALAAGASAPARRSGGLQRDPLRAARRHPVADAAPDLPALAARLNSLYATDKMAAGHVRWTWGRRSESRRP